MGLHVPIRSFHFTRAVLLLLFAPLAQSALAAAPADQPEPLDEVVVNATRLNQILKEMVQIEDRFFELYNTLNTIDDFDTNCYMEARVGSLVKRRYCRAVYANKAYEKEGQEYFRKFPSILDPTPPTWTPTEPVIMAIEARRKEYQKNMLEVVRQNPELVEMARRRYEMTKRYDAARREAFGLKPLPTKDEAASVTQAAP